MWRFFIKEDIDRAGYEWAPKTIIFCPFCHEKSTFYNQLPANECKFCHKVMPFPSAMVKEQKKRIEYHLSERDNVQIDTAGNS
jgi:hypothetical protein